MPGLPPDLPASPLPNPPAAYRPSGSHLQVKTKLTPGERQLAAAEELAEHDVDVAIRVGLAAFAVSGAGWPACLLACLPACLLACLPARLL